jgi:uncharacterized membrane protein
MSFAAITICVASQGVFVVVIIVYFVIDSVRKLLDTPTYADKCKCREHHRQKKSDIGQNKVEYEGKSLSTTQRSVGIQTQRKR